MRRNINNVPCQHINRYVSHTITQRTKRRRSLYRQRAATPTIFILNATHVLFWKTLTDRYRITPTTQISIKPHKITFANAILVFMYLNGLGWSQSPRGLRRESAAARLFDCGFESHRGHGYLSLVSIVLSGRDLCIELITRPEESYQLWCVVVCDLETSWMMRPWPTEGSSPPQKKGPGDVHALIHTCNRIRICIINVNSCLDGN